MQYSNKNKSSILWDSVSSLFSNFELRAVPFQVQVLLGYVQIASSPALFALGIILLSLSLSLLRPICSFHFKCKNF